MSFEGLDTKKTPGPPEIPKSPEKPQPERETIELSPEDIEVVGEGNEAALAEAIGNIEEENVREEINPPIKPGEIFDPSEEMEKLWNFHGKEGIAKLREYNKKSEYQRWGLAELQAVMIQEARESFGVSEEEAEKNMIEIANAYREKYGFCDNQMKIIGDTYRKYSKLHRAIEKITTENADPAELYEKLFGAKPQGEIEVIPGPITLYFRCHNPDDFTRIAYQYIFLKKGDNYKLTSKERKKVAEALGISIDVSRVPELQGTIIAENCSVSGHEAGKESEINRIHEEQHAFKRFFAPAADASFNPDPVAIQNSESAIKSAFRDHVATRRVYAEESAKDEILAYMKSGNLSVEEIINKLTKGRKSGGAYDYFAEDVENVMRIPKKLATRTLVPQKNIEKIARQNINEVYDKKDYERVLRGGVDAFKWLWRTYGAIIDNQHYKEKIIALLVREPLKNWPKVVRRLIEARGKKEPDFTEQEEQWFKKEK